MVTSAPETPKLEGSCMSPDSSAFWPIATLAQKANTGASRIPVISACSRPPNDRVPRVGRQWPGGLIEGSLMIPRRPGHLLGFPRPDSQPVNPAVGPERREQECWYASFPAHL